MSLLEIKDLTAKEWGDDAIYLMQVSESILRNYRDRYPAHVSSVNPGDWVICGFGGIMYGHSEFIRHLAPMFDISTTTYFEEFNTVSNLMTKLNRTAA